MRDSPLTRMGTKIPRNLLNGNGFADETGMESEDKNGIVIRGLYPTRCHPAQSLEFASSTRTKTTIIYLLY